MSVHHLTEWVLLGLYAVLLLALIGYGPGQNLITQNGFALVSAAGI